MTCPRCFKPSLQQKAGSRNSETLWGCSTPHCYWRGTIDDASGEQHAREIAAEREATNKELLAALEPFAKVAESVDVDWDAEDVLHVSVQLAGPKPKSPHLTFGDLRRALRAVEGEGHGR